MRTDRAYRAVLAAASMTFLLMLGACGGDDAPATPSSQAFLSAPTTAVTEGDEAFNITLVGAKPTDAPIAWATTPASAAAWLSAQSNAGVTYTPPAIGALPADQQVTVTATTSSGATASVSVSNRRKRNYLELVAGSGARAAVDGIGRAAGFVGPMGLAIDVNRRRLYVADGVLIRAINLLTAEVSTLAGSGVVGDVDGLGTAAQFRSAAALAIDAAGNLYVGDSLACTIRKITPDAVVTTLAGQSPCSPFDLPLDGAGAAARFGRPLSLALDRAGNLYVADVFPQGEVRKVSPGGVVTTLGRVPGLLSVAVSAAGDVIYAGSAGGTLMSAGLGASGFVPPSTVTALSASFNEPDQIVLDEANQILYVADTFHNTIWLMGVTGDPFSIVAGIPGAPAFVPGPLPALLTGPRGLARDSNGDLYVADLWSRHIARVVLP